MFVFSGNFKFETGLLLSPQKHTDEPLHNGRLGDRIKWPL